MLDAAWNDHPYRRPKTYVELLEQRQNRQARVLTGGHPRLDGGSREPPELSVSPRRRKAGDPSDSGAHAGPRDPHRAGRRVGWADAEPPASSTTEATLTLVSLTWLGSRIGLGSGLGSGSGSLRVRVRIRVRATLTSTACAVE